MKEKDLLRLIGLVDDDLVEGAERWRPSQPARRQTPRWMPILAACACMVIVIGLAARVVPGLWMSETEQAPAAADECPAEEAAVEEPAAEAPEAEYEEAAPAAPTTEAPASEEAVEESVEEEAPAEDGTSTEQDLPPQYTGGAESTPLDVGGLCLLGVGLDADEQLAQELLGEPIHRTTPVDADGVRSYTARYAPNGDDATVELTFTDAGDGYRVSRLLLDELSGTLTLENGMTIGMDRQELAELLAVIGGDAIVLERDDNMLITAVDYPLQVRVDFTGDTISRVEITKT